MFLLKIYHWNAINMFSPICVDIPCLRYLQEQRSNDVHSLHIYFSYPCLTTIFELPLYQFFLLLAKRVNREFYVFRVRKDILKTKMVYAGD